MILMHFRAYAFATFLLFALTGLGQTHATEVLINGGFESGALAPWYVPVEDETWEVVSDNPHTGQFSAFTATGGTAITTPTLQQDFAAVLVDDIVSAGTWYFNEPTGAQGTAALATLFFFSDGTRVQDTEFVESPNYLPNTWVFRDFMETLNANRGKYLVGIGFFDRGNTRQYYDDVSIRMVPEPQFTMPFLLASAIFMFPRKSGQSRLQRVGCPAHFGPCVG